MTRRFKVTDAYLVHSAGTKSYQLITLEDNQTGAAVGIQLWGAKGVATPQHKFVTGSITSVRSAQQAKTEEKKRGRSSGSYKHDGPATIIEVDASGLESTITSALTITGSSITTATSIAVEAINNLGESFKELATGQREAEQAAKVAKEEAARKERDEVYAGAWGAW